MRQNTEMKNEDRIAIARDILEMIADHCYDGSQPEKSDLAIVKIVNVLAMAESHGWRQGALSVTKAFVGGEK